MPQLTLEISRLAQEDLYRIYDFLVDNNAQKQANAVMATLLSAFNTLLETPNLGKPYAVTNKDNVAVIFKEWKVKYGKSGYSFLYRIEDNKVIIITVKHYREQHYLF